METAPSDSTHFLKIEWTLARSLLDHHPTDNIWKRFHKQTETGLDEKLKTSTTKVFVVQNNTAGYSYTGFGLEIKYLTSRTGAIHE